MSTPISDVQGNQNVPSKLRIDIDDGPIAYVRIRGIMDQSFDGKRLAASFKAAKVIIDLRQARRIASVAVPLWTDLVNAVTARPDADMYIVECVPHVLAQFNMLVGLQGRAKLVSFYAPYRCHNCSAEFEVLVLLPRDRPIVRDGNPPDHPCPKCGGRGDIDDDPVAFFAAAARQTYFDIDHEVAAFLRSHLKYQFASDARRLQVEGHAVRSSMSYIRISGTIDRSFPAEAVVRGLVGKAVIDLSAAKLADQGGVTQWRAMIRAAQPQVSSITLIECPPGFLERALVPEDVDERLQVLSFQVEYECIGCTTRVTHSVDAAVHHVGLRSATFPNVSCATCNIPMTPMPSEDLLALLRIIARPTPTPDLRRFAEKCVKRPSTKLKDVLLFRPARAMPPALMRAVYVTAALGMIILAVVAVLAFRLQSSQTVVQAPAAAPAAASRAPEAAKLERPPWIISDTPASSYCHDLINHFMCVGVSSYQKSRDAAAAEANEAALEEISNAVGLKISDESFKRTVIPMYQDSRQRALGALETSVDRTTSDAYKKLLTQAREARARAAASLRAVGGSAVPAQRSDWYWEEYAPEIGTEADFLVFVRYDVSLDSIKALVERFSTPVEVGDSAAITVFPGLAWRLPQVQGGAMIVRVGAALNKAGVKEQSIVTAVGGEAIRDAAQLGDHLKKSPKASLTMILSPAENSTPQTVELH